ncbi:MAG TPA: TIGR04282 family arsenosugar biosynthesis glycosyltransferase [Thermomicrobiales bacterium]|nr:TIGR04282 family arsenosugar biosynthesis glycosyltransferase [Thermomicrobiales bacterium]
MNARRSANLLMLAARAAVPGETKTRLGRVIGMERAAELYEAFLRDLAARLTRDRGGHDVAWTYSPPEIDFLPWLERIGARSGPGIHVVPQQGQDWGVRQDYLLRWGHEQGYERSVLIATDSPHLERAVIDQAFEGLQSHDIALGRVHDGGYYLIGMAGYWDVLRNVPMSTSSAADSLIGQARSLGRSLIEMPATFDVDEARDLQHLVRALSPDGKDSPATWAALERLGLRDDVVGS